MSRAQKYSWRRAPNDGASGARDMVTSIASEPLEPSSRNRHQLWDPRDVPVRVGDLCVPEVGRERSDALLDIDAVAVPAEETAAGERVTEIVDPRTSPGPRAGWDHAVDERPA